MKVICFGDSNTWGYDPCTRFGESYKRRWTDILSEITGWTVMNEGVNGREVLSEPASVPQNTDLFLVMLGTNDLLQLDTPEATVQRMRSFLSTCCAEKTILITPPPMKWGDWVQDQELIEDSIRLAQLYLSLGHTMNIRVLDTTDWSIPFAFDGVHFTEEGQTFFARKLAEALLEESYDRLHFS